MENILENKTVVKEYGWDTDEVYMVGDEGTLVRFQEFIIEKEEEFGRDFCIIEKYGEIAIKSIDDILKECAPARHT